MTNPMIGPIALRLPSHPRARLLAGVGAACALALVILGAPRLIAQIEGDRGIVPVVSTGDIEVGGIDVETTGKTAQEARLAGWHMAYRKAWEQIHGPQLGDDALEAMVAAVTVEREQLGPHRYIARLAVTFDRQRAGQYGAGPEGNGGVAVRRSAPMLVIPVLYSGGVAQVYEVRGPWQRAWAEFRTGASTIDYVRPTGGGGDSLLVTAGQMGRRSRVWWRNILDQFGASDVVFPVARLERQWPGGPVKGTFTARYGPDNVYLDSFTLTAKDEGDVSDMLRKALARMDGIYVDALARGVLQPDSTLSIDHPALDPGLAAIIARGERARAEAERAAAAAAAQQAQSQLQATPSASPTPAESTKEKEARGVAVTIQFASPDAHAIDMTLSALRGLPHVEGAATISIAIGGTSVMRVTYGGDPKDLASALKARGWQVSGGGALLRIKR